MRKITHRMDVETLGGTARELGNTLRAKQAVALSKQRQGIKLSRAERRALKRWKGDA